jgi:cobaltochelatase CobN
VHLLAAQPGVVSDGSEAVDLGQSPGDIVVLSAADTELACLAAARAGFDGDFPSVRLANLLQLGHNMSVDVYVESVISSARLVIVRLLGGAGYWPYGVERIAETCRAAGIALAMLPGDDQPDAELARLSTLPPETCHRLWQFTVHGGAANASSLLAYAATLVGFDAEWREPAPLLRAGLYWPGMIDPDLERLRARWRGDAPIAALVFYRALVQAGDLAPIEAMIEALQGAGLNPLPIYLHSLKEPVSADTIVRLFATAPPDVILNATGFAVSTPGETRRATPFDATGCPVLQIVFAGLTEDAWRAAPTGLAARDIAMNIALPEVDGRVLARAVAFKSEARHDQATQTSVISYRPVADRVEFAANLAAGWARLARTVAADRRVAVVLANYPNRDGRLANGVGLDTPAGTVELMRALGDTGWQINGAPADGRKLIELLQSGPTNAIGSERTGGEALPLDRYMAALDELPSAARDAMLARWGAPEDDPFFRDGAFRLAAHILGNCVVAIQPARGYNIDPQASYHDPDLVPPHGYLAFYVWLRQVFDVHAIVHMGKHGNLEWLPGKSVALTGECWPEIALGPVPHVYPFIVNDPGEGTQAKRRAAAVIVDHLTPPLARAETYGDLAELERLVDEYYEAAGVDPRRLGVLRDDILDLTRRSGLDKDCGIIADEEDTPALAKLDNYLCEIKEMQIRDGLHVFGVSPEDGLLTSLLVALVRLPRGGGEGGDASLIRALARDLGLDGFDPLDCVLGDPWPGPRPGQLTLDAAWRTYGDTVERLELLAETLVAGARGVEPGWTATAAVIDQIDTRIRPAVEACGAAEIAGVLTALDGRFVEPGPSGAPTRGRPEVLPTGRNFYSIDTRTVPTPAAWRLGWKSATLLIECYRQEHGEWPRRMALSAWGTSNMRTGGDDIAQAMALMGVQPAWGVGTGRVTGFEVMPATVLDRPRVDVTFRLSGFFRDAFPAQIDLLDSAVRAVAALDEPADVNPLAARVRADTSRLTAEGIAPEEAERRAGFRLFGSKPGAYGAGLQALIDERGWETDADLARAYLAWGGYAYGAGAAGAAEHRLFEARLGDVEAVVHNQDNREHDLLDSDDYYQFEGGMTAAVRTLSGRQPAVYHNDHSRPESPRIRALSEEIARVVRARVVNPKWIAGVMRHGYKGAFEMAATVDYLFAFAASAHAVEDHHFDLVFDAYLGDAEVRAFLEDCNPAAMKEMAERLLEAQERGLWRPRSNSASTDLEALAVR